MKVLVTGGAGFIHTDIRNKNSVERVMIGRGVVLHLADSVGNKRPIDNPLSNDAINDIGALGVCCP
jgi:hypothetical protein